MPRSVRGSAPSRQSGGSEEISATAGASTNHLLRHCQLIMQRVRSRDQVPGDSALRAVTDFESTILLGSNNEITGWAPVLLRDNLFQSSRAPTPIPRRQSPAGDATRGGEIPIISQNARILNNRC